MGYRSDVLLVASTESFVAGVLADPNLAQVLNLADTRDEHDGSTIYIFNGWKWYEFNNEFKDVQTIRNLANNMARNQIPYGFIRIGEDVDDIEIEGTPWDWNCYVNRELSYGG